MKSSKKYVQCLTVLICVNIVSSSFLEYIWPQRDQEQTGTDLEEFPSVPYELDAKDETFLKDASKWIGVHLSKLDICHHRVILKLKNSCNELNAEQIGKLAVMLLNCQSDSEGRKLFACNEEMSLKECTSDMDTDTWNAYHLITNRAKAVCASVRHDQFRGLTELTVNKLMNTAHDQIAMMDKLSENQKQLQEITAQAIDEMADNHFKLINQQNDMLKLSETHRAKVESNFRDLVREKGLIRSGQTEVANLLTGLKDKIDESIKQLELQSKRSKLNHASLLNDMESLQSSAHKISGKIDETTDHFSSHYQFASKQYQYTLDQLEKINSTIIHLSKLINSLQENFDQKLNWITEKVGGTDDVMKRLNVIITHVCYLLLGMLCLAFVNADKFTRIFFVLSVPANLLANILDFYSLDIFQFTCVLGTVIIANIVRILTMKFISKDSFNMNLQDETQNIVNGADTNGTKSYEDDEVTHINNSSSFRNYKPPRLSDSREGSLTPLSRRLLEDSLSSARQSSTPYSLSMQERVQCTAITLKGEQCRNAAVEEKMYCRTHDRRAFYER